MTSYTVQSAPPTPGSSSWRPSITEYLTKQLEPRRSTSIAHQQSFPFFDAGGESSFYEAPTASEAQNTGFTEDPIDREELSSTPLLPPLFSSLRPASDEALQSPLQSPSVASYSETASLANAPLDGPMSCGLLTPPLSAKPSVTSFGVLPSSVYSGPEQDHWAIRLGHANFDIEPKPYMPQQCTRATCRRLLDDWSSARVEYMRIVARVSEHYGPSSPTYKMTEAKWAEIDKEWRCNLDKANSEAEAHGETPVSQCLAETQPLAKMPSLSDPNQPTKFLNVDEADIVGPMVKYVNIQQLPTKRAGLFGLLKDQSSVLGRTLFGSRR